MKITTRISVNGEAAMHRFPVLGCTIDELCDLGKGGAFDVSKARSQLADKEGVTTEEDDNTAVYAVACEYLKQQESVVAALCEETKRRQAKCGAHREIITREDKSLDRRMRNGRVAFVNVIIRYLPSIDGIRATIKVSNPKNLVGDTDTLLNEYATMCARILTYMARELGGGKRMNFEVKEGEGAEGVVARARRMDAEDEMRAKREHCPYLVNGYCTPIHPDCPCYEMGVCKEVAK